MSSFEEEFASAVSLVQKLPKNGPFKPSDNVRLKLYGLYKQATQGPNTSPQPSFMWDPVGRYKWKAWSDLGKTSTDSAMQLYIAELKQLVKDIPETGETIDFLNIFNSKFGGDSGCCGELVGTYNTLERSQECVEVMHRLESDNDEYCDTVTRPAEHPLTLDTSTLDNSTEHSSDSTQDTVRKKDKRPRKSTKHSDSTLGSSEACSSDVRIIDVESQILRTLRLMRQDVRGLLKRMDTLENLLARHLLSQTLSSESALTHTLWDKRWLLFVVGWPVLTQVFSLWYVRKYHRRR